MRFAMADIGFCFHSLNNAERIPLVSQDPNERFVIVWFLVGESVRKVCTTIFNPAWNFVRTICPVSVGITIPLDP